MEVSGKIVKVFPLQKGEGKNGPWRKQEYLLETPGTYPKKVHFSVWGDKIDQFNLIEGIDATVSLDIDAREYNGKWYNDIRAWKVGKTNPHIGEKSTKQTSDPIDDEDVPF